MISYKDDKFLAIFLLVKRTIRLFYLRMRGNDYLEASGQKPDPAIRSGNLDFPVIGEWLFYRYTFSQWYGDFFSAHAQK